MYIYIYLYISLSLYIYVYIYIYIHIIIIIIIIIRPEGLVRLGRRGRRHAGAVAIFCPFSQFCEAVISLPSLQKQPKTAPNLFQRGVEYGKYGYSNIATATTTTTTTSTKHNSKHTAKLL